MTLLRGAQLTVAQVLFGSDVIWNVFVTGATVVAPIEVTHPVDQSLFGVGVVLRWGVGVGGERLLAVGRLDLRSRAVEGPLAVP